MALPSHSSASYLNFCSQDDPNSAAPDFNPAQFNIVVPNSVKLQDVIRVCHNSVSIPRMFQTITQYNNVLQWWQRQVIEIPVPTAPQPNTWLRTVSQTWTLMKQLIITPGIYNRDQVLALIQGTAGVNEQWTWNDTTLSIQIVETPTGSPVVWGYFIDPSHVTPPVSYANMILLTDGDSTSFDTLGLEASAGLLSRKYASAPFDPLNPATFATTLGSNLQGATTLPLFDEEAFNYITWATQMYTTPPMSPPNFSGPLTIQVGLSDLGDGSTIYAATGTSYDVITSVSLSHTNWGDSAVKEVKDGEFEAIGLKHPRNITGFSVKLMDEQFRPVVLPRNYLVAMRLAFVYVVR